MIDDQARRSGFLAVRRVYWFKLIWRKRQHGNRIAVISAKLNLIRNMGAGVHQDNCADLPGAKSLFRHGVDQPHDIKFL